MVGGGVRIWRVLDTPESKNNSCCADAVFTTGWNGVGAV